MKTWVSFTVCCLVVFSAHADDWWVGPQDTVASWFETNSSGTYVNWNTGNLPDFWAHIYMKNRGYCLVDQPGAAITNGKNIYIGMNDDLFGAGDQSGHIIVTNGGVLQCGSIVMAGYPNSRSGTVTVVGGTVSNGAWTVGSQKYGEFFLRSGRVRSTSSLDVGSQAGSSGKWEMSGGTADFSGGFTIGNSGYGTATVSGGTASFAASTVGSGWTGRVAQTGGDVHVTGLTVGNSGDGAYRMDGTGVLHVGTSGLTIAGQAAGAGLFELLDGTVYCGNNVRSRGAAEFRISGGVFVQTNGTFHMGYFNSSAPSVYRQSGGTVQCNDWAAFPHGNNTTNTFIMEGGELIIPSVVRFPNGSDSRTIGTISGGTIRMGNHTYLSYGAGGDSVITQTGGTYDGRYRSFHFGWSSDATRAVYNLQGGQLVAHSVWTSMASGFALNFTGGELDARYYEATMGTLTNAGGTVSPGLAGVPGRNDVYGDYTESTTDAKVRIDIGGTAQANASTNGAGYYDYYSVSGTATLAGTLEVAIVDGFENSILASDSFTVLRGNTALNGEFANAPNGKRMLTVEGHSFLVTYTANDVVLSQFHHIPHGSAVILK